MLKTRQDNTTWLVHQPDHARVSGFLAAHWGGANGFARPGHFPSSVNPELWRQEVVLAIAEHDNGWWEWEASPPFDPHDGLPVGLADVSRLQPREGLRRWRLGVPRLADQHPYASLLMSLHPFWLYAFAFPDLAGEADDPFRHALFGGRDEASNLVAHPEETRKLLDELLTFQKQLKERLKASGDWAAAVEPDHLYPNFKLLQLMDALSLLLALNRQEERHLEDIPRHGWNDRISLKWRPSGNRRVVCDPYPFDTDPLEVFLPARIVDTASRNDEESALPLTRLHATPLQTLRFVLCSSNPTSRQN